MGAGSEHAKRKAQTRANAQPAPVVRIDQQRERDSVYGRDAPPATLIKWRGELWNTLSWSDVVSMMVTAETSGATENWARLTRRMYQDGQILAVRGTRLDPVSGADFDVAPGGPSQADALAASDTELMLRSLPDLPRTLDAVLDAVFVGWSVQEIIWGVRGAWTWPEAISVLEPHRFRFNDLIQPYLWDDGRLGNDPSANSQIRQMGKALRENKFIVHMPRVIPDYPIASGLLRACARYWWPKWQSMQYWLGGAETAGNPRAIGYYATGQTDENIRQKLFDVLQQMSATGVAVTDMANKIDIINPSAQGAASIFSSIMTYCDEGITKAVLGSGLLTDAGPNGSRAMAESQGAYTIDPRLKKDSAAMWATITRDLVRPFLEFNSWRYGGRMPAMPVVTSRFVEDLEPKPTKELIDVGGVTINELRKRDGLPEWPPERGDQVAKIAPSFGAFSGMAGGVAAVPSQTDYVSAGGARAADPFKPWDLVDRMSREAE